VAHEARIGVPAGERVEIVVAKAPQAQTLRLENDRQ
jgi:hypothetical protein